jgi:hypothetical protein
MQKKENVKIIMVINLMGRNPILELDVNIFLSFSKYVLKIITINSDTGLLILVLTICSVKTLAVILPTIILQKSSSNCHKI